MELKLGSGPYSLGPYSLLLHEGRYSYLQGPAVSLHFSGHSEADIRPFGALSQKEIVKSLRSVKILQYAVKGACIKGDLEMVKLLVSKGVDIYESDNFAYCMAARHGHLALVKYLEGLGVKAREIGYPLVSYAASERYEINPDGVNRRLEMLKHLVSQGVERKYSENAIYMSSIHGHLEEAKYLVSKGYDPRFNNDLPLQVACQNGHVSFAKYLVENGGDVHAGSNAALDLASAGGHYEVVEYLLSVDKGTFFKKDLSDFALVAASKNGNIKVVKLLIDGGANTQDYRALSAACKKGHLSIVKYLLELDNRQTTINSAFADLCHAGQIGIAKHLQKGINGVRPSSPIFFSIPKKHFEPARYLMSQGIILAEEAMVAWDLYEAIGSRDFNRVKYLVSQGVKLVHNIRGEYFSSSEQGEISKDAKIKAFFKQDKKAQEAQSERFSRTLYIKDLLKGI